MAKMTKAGVLRKGTQTDHPVDRLFGELKLDQPVHEILDQMRGPRPVRRNKTDRAEPVKVSVDS